MRQILFIFTLTLFLPQTANGQFVERENADAKARAVYSSGILNRADALTKQKLSETINFSEADKFSLDPNRLFLSYPYNVRFYYISNGTGLPGKMDFYLRKIGQATSGGKRGTAFPNLPTFNGLGGDMEKEDYYDFGVLPEGTIIDPIFVVLKSIHVQQETTFFTDPSRNPNGKTRMVAFVMEDRYIVLGYEDYIDFDYNDIIVVLDIGGKNAKALKDPIFPH